MKERGVLLNVSITSVITCRAVNQMAATKRSSAAQHLKTVGVSIGLGTRFHTLEPRLHSSAREWVSLKVANVLGFTIKLESFALRDLTQIELVM